MHIDRGTCFNLINYYKYSYSLLISLIVTLRNTDKFTSGGREQSELILR